MGLDYVLDPKYVPTRLDAISAVARSTNATELDIGGAHILPELIDALVGTPFGDRIERFGNIDPEWSDFDTNLEPEAVLVAARGFPRLQSLTIPQGSTMGGPDFYAKLARKSHPQGAECARQQSDHRRLYSCCMRTPQLGVS